MESKNDQAKSKGFVSNEIAEYIKKSIVKLSILVVLGILFVAIFGFIKASYLEKTLTNSIRSLEKVNTLHVAVKIDARSLSMGKDGVKIILNSDIDKTDIENIKLNGDLHLFGMGFSAKADIKLVDKISYFHLNKIPPIFAKSLSPFLNKWYSLSKDDLEEYAKYYDYAYGYSTSSLNVFDGGSISAANETIDLLINKYKIFDKIKYEGSDMIDNDKVKRYAVTIDKKALVTFYNDYITQVLKDQGLDENTEDLKNVITNMFDEIEIFPLVMSIGQDGIIRNLKISLKNNINSENSDYDEYNDPMTVDVEINYSSLNSPVTISRPSESEPLVDTVQKFINEARQKSIDAMTKSYLSNVRSSAEVYWDRNLSYAGFCKSEGYVDITKYLSQNGTKVTCLANSKQYSISAPLNTGKYFCVDSTGMATDMSFVAASSKCK